MTSCAMHELFLAHDITRSSIRVLKLTIDFIRTNEASVNGLLGRFLMKLCSKTLLIALLTDKISQ
jgi:hypothetical protein